MRDFDLFDQTMSASIIDKETESFNHKDKKERRKWTSFPDATWGHKEIRGGTIDEQGKINRDYASHYPVDSLQRHTNLQKNEPDIRPVNSVKGFSEIKLEDKDTFVSGFDRVQDFFGNGYRLWDLVIF